MVKRISARQQQKDQQKSGAIRNIVIVVVIILVVAFFYGRAVLSNRTIDEVTLCPSDPDSVTVLLVDVTDPMNLPQRQDFINQLTRLTESIPRYGKLVVMKVDPVSDRLLEPVITRCNPGRASDENEVSGNPLKLEETYQEKFHEPLIASFEGVMQASSADRSPILESIQSAALTQLQSSDVADKKRKLIIASDLLQNTDSVSFYGTLPDANTLISSQPFRRVRTDLRGVEVELWMLQRIDSSQTQPRALPDLWDKIIQAQDGQMNRLYTVSG